MKTTPFRRRQDRGQAVVELALLMPWIIFLFVAVFDFGFYVYALISVEDAARVAATNAASSAVAAADPMVPCTSVAAQLKTLPNVGTVTCTCIGSTCTAGTYVSVSSSYLSGVSGVPAGVDGDPAVEVSITYQTIPMIPLPFLRGNYTFTRRVQMRL